MEPSKLQLPHLLRLQTVPNIATHDFAQEYMKQYNESQTLENKISECQISAVDMFLYDFPAYFVGNTNVINDSALILQRGSIYRDTAKLSEMLGGIWINAQNSKDHAGRPIQDIYRLFYLDMLLAINYMCGESYWNEIGMYLEGLNTNGSNTFVMPIIANVMVTRYPGEAVAYASTLPDYYGYISGTGAFLQMRTLGDYTPTFVQQENDGRQDLTSNYAAHTQEWWGRYENMLPDKSPVKNYYWNRRKLWWTSVAGNSNSPYNPIRKR